MIIVTFWDDSWRNCSRAYKSCRWHTLNRHSGVTCSWERGHRSKVVWIRVTKFSGKVYNCSKLEHWKIRCNPLLFTRVIHEKPMGWGSSRIPYKCELDLDSSRFEVGSMVKHPEVIYEQKRPFCQKWGFANNFWTKKDIDMMRGPTRSLIEVRQKMRMPERSDQHLIAGQGHVMTQGDRSCCVSVDPSWEDKYNETTQKSLPIFKRELLAKKNYWWPQVTTDYLYEG